MYLFFGLTDEYKVRLHELIFELCYHGHFDYASVYEMPVQYRSFYVGKLINVNEKERTRYEAAQSNADAPKKIVKGPAIKSQ